MKKLGVIQFFSWFAFFTLWSMANPAITEHIFNSPIPIISDFDFILHFSKKNYFACVNKPLAYYRIHNDQLQKKELINQNLN